MLFERGELIKTIDKCISADSLLHEVNLPKRDIFTRVGIGLGLIALGFGLIGAIGAVVSANVLSPSSGNSIKSISNTNSNAIIECATAISTNNTNNMVKKVVKNNNMKPGVPAKKKINSVQVIGGATQLALLGAVGINAVTKGVYNEVVDFLELTFSNLRSEDKHSTLVLLTEMLLGLNGLNNVSDQVLEKLIANSITNQEIKFPENSLYHKLTTSTQKEIEKRLFVTKALYLIKNYEQTTQFIGFIGVKNQENPN